MCHSDYLFIPQFTQPARRRCYSYAKRRKTNVCLPELHIQFPLFQEPIILQCSKELEPIGRRLIEGLSYWGKPLHMGIYCLNVWVEICLLAWIYILATIALNFTMFTENNIVIIFSHVLQTICVYKMQKQCSRQNLNFC